MRPTNVLTTIHQVQTSTTSTQTFTDNGRTVEDDKAMTLVESLRASGSGIFKCSSLKTSHIFRIAPRFIHNDRPHHNHNWFSTRKINCSWPWIYNPPYEHESALIIIEGGPAETIDRCWRPITSLLTHISERWEVMLCQHVMIVQRRSVFLFLGPRCGQSKVSRRETHDERTKASECLSDAATQRRLSVWPPRRWNVARQFHGELSSRLEDLRVGPSIRPLVPKPPAWRFWMWSDIDMVPLWCSCSPLTSSHTLVHCMHWYTCTQVG